MEGAVSMEQIPRFVKGYVKIRLESPMPERFLSLCVHNQIPVWNLKNRDLYYEMELSVKDFFRLNPFRRKTQSRIILLEKHGMPFFFQKNQKRKAFFLGSFLFLSLLYLCSLFIWDIRVEGNHYNSKETILETLQTFQVKDGILKKNLDCRQIASQIRASFPNVVWVSARINGTCLVLEIKENEDSYQESSTKEQEGAQMKNWNLAASQNGVIVRMITRSGMPLAKEGDACKIGDILVSGKLEILDNDAQVQRYEYVQADADIDLLTTYAYYDEFPLKHTVKEYIGPKKISYDPFVRQGIFHVPGRSGTYRGLSNGISRISHLQFLPSGFLREYHRCAVSEKRSCLRKRGGSGNFCKTSAGLSGTSGAAGRCDSG